MRASPEARTLSFRQQRILADLCEGFTQKEVVLHLGISLCMVGIEVARLKRPSLPFPCYARDRVSNLYRNLYRKKLT